VRRRSERSERYDEETQTISRRAIEQGRRAYDEERAEAARPRRRADEFETQHYEPEEPRSRRYADEEPPRRAARIEEEPPRRTPRVEEEPPRRAVRVEEDEPPLRRPVRSADDQPRRPVRFDEEPPRRARAQLEAAPRQRLYTEDEEPAPRRYADAEPEPAARPVRRYADEDAYDGAPRQPAERPRGPRYPQDDPPPRGGRRTRERDDVDHADSGRHSRSEFVDMAQQGGGGDWRDSADHEPRAVREPRVDREPRAVRETRADRPGRGGYEMDPDDSPTLVDMASRRALRAEQQEVPVRASRGARRGRGRGNEMADDDGYWRQLRGEAQ
jgi:hypothetical protein